MFTLAGAELSRRRSLQETLDSALRADSRAAVDKEVIDA
jgi:hypothetical protein